MYSVHPLSQYVMQVYSIATFISKLNIIVLHYDETVFTISSKLNSFISQDELRDRVKKIQFSNKCLDSVHGRTHVGLSTNSHILTL